MAYVTQVDWAFAETPGPTGLTSSGLARQRIVGREQGAVHTELATAVLHPGGWIAPHVHAYEEALYVLDGDLVLRLGDDVHRLTTGDFAHMAVGLRHSLANTSTAPVRLLSLNSPLRQDPDSGHHDTFFDPPEDVGALDAAATRPRFGDPTLRRVGHYLGTPPQLEALAVHDPARGRAPIGMDIAILAYSGISVKMLVDRVFGADLVTMFTVDYEPGGAAQQHDHPFEEAYFFLEGEIEAELDGEHHVIRAGDLVFAPVGSVHGFYNTSPGRVRWIETQAPQPPVRHAYRWWASWERYAADR